jgi:hypothetical protein
VRSLVKSFKVHLLSGKGKGMPRRHPVIRQPPPIISRLVLCHSLIDGSQIRVFG